MIGYGEGGQTWARMAVLIETCKINTIDPNACPCSALDAITNGQSEFRIDDRLP